MKIRKLAITNVRSFLDETVLILDGDISIIVGPNGGGKTNLLDTLFTVLRKHLMPAWYSRAEGLEGKLRFVHNDSLQSLILEKHTLGKELPQKIEVIVEITGQDIENIKTIKNDLEEIRSRAKSYYLDLHANYIDSWEPNSLVAGTLVTYVIQNNQLQTNAQLPTNSFVEYLSNFEWISKVREEASLEPIPTPLLYLPVNRATNGFQTTVQLSGFNYYEQKKNTDITTSRTGGGIMGLAIGRLAQHFRLLLERDTGKTREDFYSQPQMISLTEMLTNLGYQWELICTNPNANAYDVMLTKQSSSFLVSAASSGEKELLNYLFSIYALNVRDALIVVDEPELHLHPRWQKVLLAMFEKLSASTGNQFLLATHSSVFISPKSIEYVSRVFTEAQKSRILKLNNAGLPEPRHLFNIVNSHNNESIFFANRVVLVEGLSDKLFFEAVIRKIAVNDGNSFIYEVISVGGKGFFAAYSTLLRACAVDFVVIADLDYIEQIGSAELKGLFKINAAEIKEDVIENIKSKDAEALVTAIDLAFTNGSWENANELWMYIKSRRIKLKENLNEKEEELLNSFIETQRIEKINILKKGTLEAYLPTGYQSKSMEKLIRLLNIDNFWDLLDSSSQAELKSIVQTII